MTSPVLETFRQSSTAKTLIFLKTEKDNAKLIESKETTLWKSTKYSKLYNTLGYGSRSAKGVLANEKYTAKVFQ